MFILLLQGFLVAEKEDLSPPQRGSHSGFAGTRYPTSERWQFWGQILPCQRWWIFCYFPSYKKAESTGKALYSGAKGIATWQLRKGIISLWKYQNTLTCPQSFIWCCFSKYNAMHAFLWASFIELDQAHFHLPCLRVSETSYKGKQNPCLEPVCIFVLELNDVKYVEGVMHGDLNHCTEYNGGIKCLFLTKSIDQ